MAVDRARAEAAIRELLSACGLGEEDPRLSRTPQRVAAAAEELLGGENVDPVPMLRAGRISVAGDPPLSVDPVETRPSVDPVETRSSVDPVDTCSSVEPVDTCSSVEPVDTCSSVEPVETRSSVDPVETRSSVDPVETRSSVEPVETRSSVDPVEPSSSVEPVEARPSVELVETCSSVEPVEASLSVDPDETPGGGNLVLVRNIRFRAMCEHHLLPFDGWVHLAYLPGDSIIGFGRLYDLVEICSSRLTLQERLGEDLVDAIMAGLDAQGALAVIEARQGCVADRGPRQADSESVSLVSRGALRDPQVRADALRLIALGGTNRDGA